MRVSTVRLPHTQPHQDRPKAAMMRFHNQPESPPRDEDPGLLGPIFTSRGRW